MAETFTNNAQSTLNGGIDNVVTSLVVAVGTTFPATGNFRIIIDSEIIIVGARSGTTLSSLTRGAEGTTAASHSNGALVTHIWTKGGLDAYLKDISHLAVSGTPDGTKFLRDDLVVADLNVVVAVRVLTGSGTYTPTAGTKRIVVECVGGGGAGGGCPLAANARGGGGGGGAYARSMLTSGFASVSYVVGAGGTGVSNAAGNAGADTTWGTTTIVAKGGSGGPVGGAANVDGGAGGTAAASTGTVKIDGQSGQMATVAGGSVSGGDGGNSTRGPGARGRATVGNGNAGGQYGGGGGGGYEAGSASARVGGAGGAGTIIVTEYA